MSLTSANGRTNVHDADTSGHLLSSSIGAVTSRGIRVGALTYHPNWLQVLPLLHELARRRPDHMQRPYLSVSVSCGMTSEHVDHNSSFTSLIAVGRFRGGALQVRHPSGVKVTLPVKVQWQTFDGALKHQTQPYDGERYSIALYVPGSAHLLTTGHLRALERLGFPSAWWRAERDWRQDASLRLIASAELEYDFPEVPATPRPATTTRIPGTPAAAIPTLEQPVDPLVDAGALYPGAASGSAS
eukprot:2598301-Amphidinium_carterae.1